MSVRKLIVFVLLFVELKFDISVKENRNDRHRIREEKWYRIGQFVSVHMSKNVVELERSLTLPWKETLS